MGWPTKRLHPTFNSLSKPGQNQHFKRLFQLKTWICLAPSQVISISVFWKYYVRIFFRFYRPIKVPHLSLKINFPISFIYSMIKLQVSQSTVSQGWDGRLRESWDKPGLATWKLDPHRIQNTTEVMYCQINWAGPLLLFKIHEFQKFHFDKFANHVKKCVVET